MTGSTRQIENLLYTYAERIDAGDFEGVADMFEHGRIAASADAPDEQALVGRDAVLRQYEESTRRYPDGTPRTKHLTSNAIIHVDEEAGTGSCRSYFTVVQATELLALQPIICGRYHDTFHRIGGEWWFGTRVMLVDLVGDLGQHLLIEL